MKKVEHFERKQRGEKINKQYKEPTIVAGMPGSGPQMHKEIIEEVMKNKFPNMNKSDSTKLNKFRFSINPVDNNKKSSVGGDLDI